MTRYLLEKTDQLLALVDNLSTGQHSSKWLPLDSSSSQAVDPEYQIYGNEEEPGRVRVLFLNLDLVTLLERLNQEPQYLSNLTNIEDPDLGSFGDVYHFAAIVGGRHLIENDPILVAKDLAIDATFFHWACHSPTPPEHIVYPSSSAAYPVTIQTAEKAQHLKESDIEFNKLSHPIFDQDSKALPYFLYSTLKQ